jgi:purine-binding chemotaxis protein CheW
VCSMEKLLVFVLSGLHCALRLADIERVLRAVEITPVPKAPGIVMGLVNVQGRVIPVLNIRKLLRLPEIETNLNDQIILARTTTFPVALVVDDVPGVAEFSEQDIVAPAELYPGLEYLEGVTKLQGGIVYIYNLDRFLSSAEKSEIEHLLSEGISMPADQET